MENKLYAPIIGGNYADPSIIRVGEDYYMTHSSYKLTPGLIIWHSRDLLHWTKVGAALTRYGGDVWAPDFAVHNGRYYIYYPAGGTNWVVTAEHPAGPWSEPVNLGIKGIDPGHTVGPDGKRYLHMSGGYIVELSDDGLSVAGEAREIYEGWRYPEDWVVEGYSLEGPKVTYHNGYYYLTVAVGGTAGPPTSHMAVSSRSRTPWGPWEHSRIIRWSAPGARKRRGGPRDMHRLLMHRTGNGGWSIMPMQAAIIRSEDRRCWSRLNGQKTAGSARLARQKPIRLLKPSSSKIPSRNRAFAWSGRQKAQNRNSVFEPVRVG